ncbi:MAG TPA: SGNH/GDSL hydrolase family protein [Steroidobacteraceae bacterium]|nr:SGNH/GDSL hydrolase family protein [Steroidobacteraceae bacterium]
MDAHDPSANRMKLRWALGFLAAIVICHPSLSRGQGALPDFHHVPYIYSQSPQVFQSLWQTANTNTLRIAILGDSQETSPTSHGYQYIPLLNYQMWQRYGNVPETPLEGCIYSYGPGQQTPADWLMIGDCYTPGPSATRLTPDEILPNVVPSAFSTLANGNHGQLTLLEQDAIDIDSGTGIPTNVNYFDTTGTVKARIFAATNPSSGDVAYQALPVQTNSPAYNATPTTSGTLGLSLQSSTYAVRSGDTAALDFGGNRYMALEVYGTDSSKPTDIIGLRFFNASKPQGVIFDTFSKGGYEAANFLTDTGNAGPMFAAFGFQAAILHYGANDAGDTTAAQFQANLTAIISRVRTWVQNPSFPVILIPDVYENIGLTASEMTEYDEYAGAVLAIAQADSNVMVVNARRLMEDIGWNASSGQSSKYLLADGVHYTALGAQTLASAEAAAMLGQILVPSCMSDPNSVTLDSATTLTINIGGTTACSGYGQYANAQTLTLNQPALKVVFTNSFTPALGAQFKILSVGSISGTFGTVTLPQLPSSEAWDTSALYTTGTIAVVTPPPPGPPTITVTSGGSQSLTLPASASPVGFSLSGTGTLTVTAQSSNTTLLPDSGITIGAGCGSTTMTCTADIALASGQTGSSTVSLTVTDGSSQQAVATASIQVSSGGGGGGGGGSSNTGGGGGSMDLVSLLGLAALALHKLFRDQRQRRDA